jgi:endonuclease III
MPSRRKSSGKGASRVQSQASKRIDVDVPKIRERLAKAIPEPRCELEHESPWQLLVATILSAQSTDKTVNEVTPELFARWPTPAALAAARAEEVEAVVHRTGFFRQKAKAIQGASRAIVAEHGGEVPRDMATITKLPGVARKTANLVLGTAHGLATGIVVDTHAKRVARRLGLTEHDDPGKVEADLCAVLPRESWIDMGHRLVLHGRYVCTARAPKCDRCALCELCPSASAEPAGTIAARARWEQVRVQSRGLGA